MTVTAERAGLPIFGSFFAYQRDRLKFLADLRTEFGDTAAYQMGSRKIIFATHPDDVAWVLQKNAKNYEKATNLTEVLGDGILTSEGEKWRRQRKLIQPVFHLSNLAALVDLMNEKARDALRKLETDARKSRLIEIPTAMTELAFQVVGHALFGPELDPHFDRLNAVMKFLDSALTRRLYRLLPIPLSVPLPSHVRYRRAIGVLDEIIYALVDGKKSEVPTTDLLALLLRARDEESGEGMDRAQIRDEVATLLLAGHETTGQTLSWTLYLLARHPEFQERAIREVDAVLAGREPKLEDLSELKYLAQILDESMRIQPAVWAFGRRALANDDLRGYPVPAGSIVLLSPYFTQRHPEFWPDAARFDPSRFDSERVESMHKFAHFPFGGGPRQCIGKHFAMMEVKIVLAQFLQRFRVEPVSSRPAVPHPQVTMSPRGGLRLRLESRAEKR